MASPVYSVILNLEGNMNRVLDEAIVKVRMLNAELSKVPRNVAPGLIPGKTPRMLPYNDEKSIWRRYRHIPPNWRDKVSQTNKWLGRHNPPFRNEGFLRNVDRTFKNLNQFSSEFLRNSFTLNGVSRNFGNAVKVISSFSHTVGAAVPAIGEVGRAGGAIAIGQGVPALAGGLGYWAGMRTLKSQSMQEAAANNMRYNMARYSLGENYDTAFRAAGDIAVSTGSSRVGTLDLISTLTGLNVGGTELSLEFATHLAEVTAKLAHAANRDMGIVGLNMQQILTSWQGIDIKELIKSVPLMGKLLYNEKKKAGSGEDETIYAFVRSNPKAFFRSLDQFNEMVKISPVAMARGQIALNRENFFLKLEKLFEPVAERIAKINTKLYDILGEAAEKFFSNQNLDNVDSILDNFQKASKTLLEAAVKFGNTAINVGSWTAENPWTTTSFLYTLFGKGPLTLKVATIIAGSIIDQSNRVKDKAEENLIEETIANPSFRIQLDQFIADADIPAYKRKQLFDAIFSNPKAPQNFGIVTDIGNIIKSPSKADEIKRLRRAAHDLAIEDPRFGLSGVRFGLLLAQGAEISTRNSKNISTGGGPLGIMALPPYPTVPSEEETRAREVAALADDIVKKLNEYTLPENTVNSLSDSFDSQSAGASDTKTIKGMSGKTRALVINFNREIVNMPTTINANDVADIRQQLEPVMEDVVVRGLTIALNNGTRMI